MPKGTSKGASGSKGSSKLSASTEIASISEFSIIVSVTLRSISSPVIGASQEEG